MTSNKSVLQENHRGVPKIALLLIALLVIIFVALLLMPRLMPSQTADVGSPGFVQATQALSAGQPVTITVENIVIYIAKDSLNLPGAISVESQEPNLFPVADQPEWTRPQIIEVLFLNTQATPVPQIVFSNPVHVCFRITSEQWEDYTRRPDAYQVQYYAVENQPQTWQSLPVTAYADMTMLCGQTMHFSLFALAIRVDDSIPVTGLTTTPVFVLPAEAEQDDPVDATNPDVPVPTAQPPTAMPQPTDTAVPPPTDVPPTNPPPTDPPPTNPPPTDPPPGGSNRKQCNDGIDNDSDGFTDTDDPECRNPGDDDEGG